MPALIEHPFSPPIAMEADRSLLDRFIETGDPAAFAAIVRRYGHVVYAASLRVLGDQGGAQDVSQETFFRLMKDPRAVNRSLAGWLHRSATHLALDVRRSEIARRNREKTYGRDRAETASPADESTWAQVSPLVDAALDELEDEDRSLVVRHFLQGIQQADLAAEMKVSAATVSRRIKAALAELHAKLQLRGVRLGIAALAILLAEGAARPASAAFLAEMAKMNLVVMLRSAAVPRPVPRCPSPFDRTRRVPTETPATPAVSSTVIYGGCLALFAVLAGLLIFFVVRVMPGSPAANHSGPAVTTVDDR